MKIKRHAGIHFSVVTGDELEASIQSGHWPEVHAYKAGKIHARVAEAGEEITTFIVWRGRLIQETHRLAQARNMFVVTNQDCVWQQQRYNTYLVGARLFARRYQATPQKGLYVPKREETTGYVVDRPIAFMPYWCEPQDENPRHLFYLMTGGLLVRAYNGGHFGIGTYEYLKTYRFWDQASAQTYHQSMVGKLPEDLQVRMGSVIEAASKKEGNRTVSIKKAGLKA